MRVSRAASPRPATSQARRAKPSADRSRRIPSPFMGLWGQVCPETISLTWKARGFPASLWAAKNRKAAGGSPRASHPNVARFTRPCDKPCRTSRRRSPRDSPSNVRNHNRPKRTPELRHRRPDLHGRILRRPAASPRVDLRRTDRSAPSPNRIDVRARFRPAHAAGLGAVDVQRPRARHRPDNPLRQDARHRRERGLSGMRHPRRVGRHARQQDRPGGRSANRLSVAIPPTIRATAMTGHGRSDCVRTCASP